MRSPRDDPCWAGNGSKSIAMDEVSYTPPDDLEIDGYHSDSFRYTVNDFTQPPVAVAFGLGLLRIIIQFDATFQGNYESRERSFRVPPTWCGHHHERYPCHPMQGSQRSAWRAIRFGISAGCVWENRLPIRSTLAFTQTVDPSTIPRLRT